MEGTGEKAHISQQLQRVLDNMRRQCSMREYCTEDIRKKVSLYLMGKGEDKKSYEEVREDVETIVSSLLKDRYIDDMRYASAFARDKSSLAAWGETKIRYALNMKHIDKEIVAAALEEIDSDKAMERLKKLLEHKARSLKGDPQAKMKLLRYGLSRGYSYDDILILQNELK